MSRGLWCCELRHGENVSYPSPRGVLTAVALDVQSPSPGLHVGLHFSVGVQAVLCRAEVDEWTGSIPGGVPIPVSPKT